MYGLDGWALVFQTKEAGSLPVTRSKKEQMKDILIYTRPDCKYCDAAKATLKNLGWEYKELEVGVDIESAVYRRDFRNTVPCIIIDDEVIGGYTELSSWIVDNI